jgi:hypothetical protein
MSGRSIVERGAGADLFDDIVNWCFTKGFLEVTVLCDFAFRYVYKDVVDLQHIVQVRLTTQ